MEKTRKTIVMILMTLLLFAASACTEKEKEEGIVGIYMPLSCSDEEGNEYELEDEELHIEENGEGYFYFQDNRYELSWNLDGNVFTFEDSSGDRFEGTFEDGRISGKYFYDYFYVFEKTEE